MEGVRSFPPLARADARVLILGSMPGEESLRRRQYYAHPANRFWPIMGELFGAGRELPYAQRVERLLESGIAVWDVLKRCVRKGSLDGSIRRDSEVVNDFAGFFRRHAGVKAVFFNGAKSEEVFARAVRDRLDPRLRQLHYARLPSTSPAHAGMPHGAKLSAWRCVPEHL